MRIEFVKRCVSTNDIAKSWLESGGEGIYGVVAGEQCGGRGRCGRRWESPPYAGVWLSVAFAGLQGRPLQTLAVGCGVLHTAKRLAPNATLAIRWPNDITTSDNRKLCGILCEATLNGVVVGVGFNLHTSLLPDGLGGVGIDEWLKPESIPDLKLHRRVSEMLSDAVREWVIRLEREGAVTIIDAVSKSMWRGTVLVVTERERFTGKVLGIDEHGALVLMTGGTRRHIVAADIRLLRLQRCDGGR